ncbi:AAA family ATPase [Schleiferilactobacillus harbinensis]|uniref:AAA family ATPase n=1 Tax=Schleiferilactobacillus harbinensis TaxID=304207 RepID=UPI0021A343F3|nr:AAA family ATPase [Schleiferilactobacillus harbinensis]MCT2907563.1 AAA family ATPase [Schleiferilactobacillus harbinensis]
MRHAVLIGKGFGKTEINRAFTDYQDGDVLRLDPGDYTLTNTWEYYGGAKVTLLGGGNSPSDVVIHTESLTVKTGSLMHLENLTMVSGQTEQNVIQVYSKGQLIVKNSIISSTATKNDYPTISANNSTVQIINSEIRCQGDNSAVLVADGGHLTVTGSIIEGIQARDKGQIQIDQAQVTHQVYIVSGSVVHANQLYLEGLTWKYSLQVGEGSQLLANYIDLPSGMTQGWIEHGLVNVTKSNTGDGHSVIFSLDSQSTVQFPEAELTERLPPKPVQKAATVTAEKKQEQAQKPKPPKEEKAPETPAAPAKPKEEAPKRPALDELNALIGLPTVKKEVAKFIAMARFNKEKRIDAGLPPLKTTYHAAFLGNPGTGKTTVARLIGRIMYENKILPSAKYREVSREDLISSNVGATASKTKAVLEAATGGVLFIDEAYSLYKEGITDFAQEAVDTLIKYMEDHRQDLMVIFAGYTDQMEDFMDMNPGLRSRVPNVFHFDDYSPDQVVAMGVAQLQADHFQFEDEDHYRQVVGRAYQQAIGANNGRWMRNFNEKLEQIVALRVMKADDEGGRIISTMVENIDIDSLVHGDEKDKEKHVQALLAELDGMIGLTPVKKFVHNLVAQVGVDKKMTDALPQDQLPTYHMVFAGPPGTGKTTVARIVAKLLHNLDILPRDTVEEVTRQDLVGRYLGETESKTSKVLRNAMGGVLFVDEAYQLSADTSGNDFGKQAIETMITSLENHRQDFVAIFAGYTEQMNEFLSSNPGLRSRIPLTIEFSAYTADEIGAIVVRQLKNGWHFDAQQVAQLAARNYQLLTEADKANGRWARNFVDKIISRQKVWLSQHPDAPDPLVLAPDVLNALDKSGGEHESQKQAAVQEVLAEIDGMIGLTNVKKFVHDLVTQVAVDKRLAGRLASANRPTYHMVFTGPPGTGKTTVARLIAKLFYNLDILPRDTVKEVTRTDLVGQYIGQTEVKTKKALDAAMGGILFVDEAYQLTSVAIDNDFGKQAIETLLTALENQRDQFVAIFAGYTDQMNEFLAANPGLRSRIPLTLTFPGYTPEEIGSIVDLQLKKDWAYDTRLLKTVARKLYTAIPEDKRGNGRWARTFAERIVKQQKLWLSQHPDVTDVQTIPDDVILDALTWRD